MNPPWERECRHEPDALLHYDGRGAVCLLDFDPDANTLLLERTRGWAIAHAVAWNGNEQMLASARALALDRS